MKRISFNTILNILLFALVAYYIGRYFYMRPKFVNGAKAPAFSGITLDGQQLNLTDLKGNYVLIDFWGSWCGPCRQENPNLVKLYQKYQNANFKTAKGFEIISIAIEKRAARWKNAIQKDGLSWPYHILDLTGDSRFFDSKIATLYGVKQIPTKYLLDERGVIISVNPSMKELEKILSQKATTDG